MMEGWRASGVAEPTQELVARARRHDADAFALLIERYEQAALAVAYAVLRDADRAGDAVQEAFLRAWTELARLQEAARFGGWLMQIVRNAALDLRRKLKPTVSTFPDLAADTAGPEERGEIRERDAQVKAALDGLDDMTRTAVILRYYDGRSAKEIAELLDVSPASIDMRLSRARGQLREVLADLAETEAAVPAHPRTIGDNP
jgi:RNA polymerase sigma-70 factor (ECF subfamily)